MEGKMVNIREIRIEDSQKYLELCKVLDEETKFRPYDPGERNYSNEEQKKKIVDIINSTNSTILVAEVNNELVGYISASGSSLNRLKHIAKIGIAIKTDYCGQGIGRGLFNALEKWGLENQIHRLELTVMTDNIGALILYKKMGFEIEGMKKHSLWINGEYADDYYMSKFI
jgi:RimJ/RimL family protein N-acetyltransferase